MNRLWRIVIVILIVCLMSTSILISGNQVKAASSENVYVGVTFGGTTVEEAKALIDKVSSYTNLFIVDSWTIDGNFTSGADLTEICDYAVKANLSVIVYFAFIYYNYTRAVGNLYNSSVWDLYGVSPWHVEWLNQAKARWGDKFLGAYLYDEPGGKQIDLGNWQGDTTTFTGGRITTFDNTSTYADAANRFTRSLNGGSMQHIVNTSIPNSVTSPTHLFTSDYALYWFDYKAGYDTVFVELGSNSPTNSKIQQIALCRGAATAQNKDWGAIVTLATDSPPTAENGSTVLNDMTMAYEAGAKYIVVFNYELNGQGILTDEHFNAMKQFWDNIHSSSADSQGKYKGEVALVLPTNYGWGMRHINDKIWGLWPAEGNASEIGNSALIWDNMNKLTDKYGLNLDIVYDDPKVSIQGLYSQTYLWNSTINFASEPSLPNEVYILASTASSIGAVACLSTYWFTKRRKQKPAPLIVQESSLNQQVLLEQPMKPTEKVESIMELNDVFNGFANVIDPLFDLLMDLHGQVNWSDIENNLTRCKLAKALGVKVAAENLNFRNLSTFIKMQQPKDTAHETKALIKVLHANVSALDSGNKSSEVTEPKYGTLKAVIFSYFMLNDVLLGQVIGDEELGKEKIELADVLDGFSEETETALFTEFADKLRQKQTDSIAVDESRGLLRKQLNEFLKWQQSFPEEPQA